MRVVFLFQCQTGREGAAKHVPSIRRFPEMFDTHIAPSCSMQNIPQSTPCSIHACLRCLLLPHEHSLFTRNASNPNLLNLPSKYDLISYTSILHPRPLHMPRQSTYNILKFHQNPSQPCIPQSNHTALVLRYSFNLENLINGCDWLKKPLRLWTAMVVFLYSIDYHNCI